jgi:hypothetical protein
VRSDLLQVEHDPQGRVDATHVFEAQVTHAGAKSTRIDRAKAGGPMGVDFRSAGASVAWV